MRSNSFFAEVTNGNNNNNGNNGNNSGVPLGAIDGLRCDSCGIGTRELHCEFSPPRCDNWYCSRGGPPCYGGSYHQYCTCVEGDVLQECNTEIYSRIDVSATSFPPTSERKVDLVAFWLPMSNIVRTPISIHSTRLSL